VVYWPKRTSPTRENIVQWEKLQEGEVWLCQISSRSWTFLSLGRRRAWKRWRWHKRSEQQRYSVRYALGWLETRGGGC